MKSAYRSILTITITAAITAGLLRWCIGPPLALDDSSPPPRILTDDPRLDRPIGNLDADQTPMPELVDRIAASAGLIVDPGWQKPMVDLIEPVTLHLDNVTPRTALNAVLAHAQDLHWYEKSGVIHIGARADLGNHQPVLRLYDIRPLLEKSRAIDHSTLSPTDVFNDKTDEDRADDCARLLVQAIDPISWKDNGGNVGSIDRLPGFLLIQQSPPNQAEIVRLIDELMRKSHG